MASLKAILVIAAKDVAQRSRDRSAYIMGLLGPLALALIMGATVGGADDPAAFELGLAVEDDGSAAAGFGDVLADLEEHRIVEMTMARDLADLERLVDDGQVAAGFHIAPGFSDAIQSARSSTITVVGDPGSPVATDVAEAIAREFAAEVDYVSLATASVLTVEGRADDAGRVAELTSAALAQPTPIELVSIRSDGRGQDLSTYYAVSLSVFFLFFTVQFGVLSLLEEREGGTLDRILMAPIARSAVLVGKLMSSLLVGVLSMIVLVAATTLFGGAEWGDPVAVGVLIVVGVTVAIAVAALVAALARTAEQAVAFATAAALVLGLLGGTFFPVSRAGGLLATVSLLSPHRWLLEGFRDVSYGAGVGDLASTFVVLVGFTVVVGGIGLAAAGAKAGAVVTVLVIAANNLRRLIRQRATLFFAFVLPLMLIVVLGVTVGGDEPRIGVHVEGEVSAQVEELIGALEQLDGVGVELIDEFGAATDELEREDITALVVVPVGYDEGVASGEATELEYRVIPTSGGFEMQSLVRSVIADQNAAIRASRLVGEQTGIPLREASERVSALAGDIAAVDVVTVDPDGDAYVDADAVGFVAAQELILFMFLMGMVAASALIQSRELGVTQRMLATPATAAHVVAGEGLGRFAVAVIQGAFIIGATALLFGLDWGSWPATAAIVVSFALVATAAALFVGALVTNENQSSAIGISLGLALAALGGCMVPFEVFPNWLRSVAHITPHAWAVDAFTEVVQRGGGLGQIGVELAVLALFGLSLLAAASVALRRAIVG